MKKITLLLLLLTISIGAYSQSSAELDWRTKDAINMAEWMLKKEKANSEEQAFAFNKLNALKKAVEISPDEETQLKDLFKSQYPVLKEAYSLYSKNKTAQAKVSLYKTIISLEDNFRAKLNDKQTIFYKSYSTEKGGLEQSTFLQYFMPEQIYYSYKKELL